MGEPGEEGVAAFVMDYGLGHDRPEPGHPLAEPGGDPAAVERQVGGAGSLGHDSSSLGTEAER